MSSYQDIRHAARPVPSRPRMPRQNRAKIFAPYDALKGFEETVHARETVYVPQVQLSEYAQECLDRKLRLVERNDTITVVWFQPRPDVTVPGFGQYLTTTDTVVRIDRDFQELCLSNWSIRISKIIEIGGEKLDRLYFGWNALTGEG